MKTKEQQKFYDLMAKKKPKTEKLKKVKEYKVWNMPPTSTIQYMRNCMFWIEEYWAGRTDEYRFKSAVKSLRDHSYKIENEKPSRITEP